MLHERASPGEIIAASERYENLNRRRQYKTAPRVLVYVTGREVMSAVVAGTGSFGVAGSPIFFEYVR